MLTAALQTTALLAVFALLALVLRWSCRERAGMVVRPFEIASRGNDYTGRAVADAMASELTRIARILRLGSFKAWELKPWVWTGNPKSKRARSASPMYWAAETMPAIQLLTDVGAKIPDISVELGGTKFSLSSVLLGARQLWTDREPEVVISGSLQVLGSSVRLIGRLDRLALGSRSGDSRQSLCVVRDCAARIKGEEVEIAGLVRDLAVQFYFELLGDKERFTETWQGLRGFTEALTSYEAYCVSSAIEDLNCATEHALVAVGIEPGNRNFFDILFQLGGDHFRHGAYDRASQLFARAASLGVDMPDTEADETGQGQLANTYNALGVCHAFQGNYPHAEVAFRRALRHNRRTTTAYMNLASIYKLEERTGELQDLLNSPECGLFESMPAAELGAWFDEFGLEDRALATLKGSEDPEAQLQLSRTLAKFDKPDEAIATCRRLIARFETSNLEVCPLLNELGLLLADRELLDAASAEYLRAIALDPDYADPHNNLGLIYKKRGEWTHARSEFLRALALDPEMTVGHLNLVELYRDGGMELLAIAQLERLLSIEPTNGSAHYQLGVMYSDQNRIDLATSQMEQAAQLDPTSPHVRDYLAYLYTKGGRLDEAVIEITKVIQIDPDNVRALAFLAALYRRLGRNGEAAAQVKVAQRRKEKIASQPGLGPLADRYLEACFAALCGDADTAIDMLRQALAEGLRTQEYARQDDDFYLLHDDPRFKELVEEVVPA